MKVENGTHVTGKCGGTEGLMTLTIPTVLTGKCGRWSHRTAESEEIEPFSPSGGLTGKFCGTVVGRRLVNSVALTGKCGPAENASIDREVRFSGRISDTSASSVTGKCGTSLLSAV